MLTIAGCRFADAAAADDDVIDARYTPILDAMSLFILPPHAAAVAAADAASAAAACR